ncbi:MAG: hypothetical protein Q4C09_05230 [Atopobiaceae bacterium]|nr:hypothetical protein [Atopobiaceae bacterium]
MKRQKSKKRMTLSEHLALRAQAAEESKAREEARLNSIRSLRELDAQVTCTCPACVKARQMRSKSSEVPHVKEGER